MQDDLYRNDVFILDAFSVVYVWKGKSSRDRENRWAMEAAVEYVACAPDGRSPTTPILRVLEGEEPIVFTCHFHAWWNKGATPVVNYDTGLEDVRALLEAFSRSYTYLELSTGQFPKALDTANLEVRYTASSSRCNRRK